MIYRVPVDGGVPERLTEHVSSNALWSPDGQTILYDDRTGGGAFFPVRALRLDKTPVKLPDFSNHGDWEAFRFTPDGNVVFLQGDFRYQDFWLANLATGEKRQLTKLKPGYSVRSFDISPDGKEIVFDRVQENSDIVLIDLRRCRQHRASSWHARCRRASFILPLKRFSVRDTHLLRADLRIASRSGDALEQARRLLFITPARLFRAIFSRFARPCDDRTVVGPPGSYVGYVQEDVPMIRQAAAVVVALCLSTSPLYAQSTHVKLTVSEASATVHKSPSTGSPVIGKAPRGTELVVTREVGDWVKVSWPSAADGAGYVRVNALARAGAAAPAAAQAPERRLPAGTAASKARRQPRPHRHRPARRRQRRNRPHGEARQPQRSGSGRREDGGRTGAGSGRLEGGGDADADAGTGRDAARRFR